VIASPPTAAFAFSHPAHAIALGFGAGLARFAPGTFGTLAAWPVGWLAAALHPLAICAALATLFFLGVWACAVTGRDLGAHDHGAMVWDEFVAFLVVLAIVPRELGWQAGAFVLFRAFDIAKPPPIRWCERRYRGGFGAMLDDLIAAGYTLIALAAAKRLVL
jgi:phosphatidylglycerophosphatase A